jgi:hypothetical protein
LNVLINVATDIIMVHQQVKDRRMDTELALEETMNYEQPSQEQERDGGNHYRDNYRQRQEGGGKYEERGQPRRGGGGGGDGRQRNYDERERYERDRQYEGGYSLKSSNMMILISWLHLMLESLKL